MTFVVAYWKILAVIRRQAKVAANLAIATFCKEPVAGTSSDKNRRENGVDNGAVTAVFRGNRQTNGSTHLSKAKINVVRTMIYISVSFTVCWMPMYFIRTVTRINVC